ncbi:MAG: Hsp70 family protein [Magnetococcales bacterium]|nr:Hsp70 family protein [Magnetococcales bacterium]
MKIGIDFGTTNSAVSYFDADRDEVHTVEFGHAQNLMRYVRSCVAMRHAPTQRTTIGAEAYGHLGSPNHRVFTHFKMLVGESDPSRLARWGFDTQHTPDGITESFFKHLLGSITNYTNIDATVITIPEVWLNEHQFNKRERLIQLCRRAGLPQPEACSEPLAAASYFLWLYKKNKGNEFCGHILTCDCGGGTMDFCLAKVDSYAEVAVLHRSGEGRIDTALGSAGVAHDETVIERLFPGLRESNLQEFYRHVNEFEQKKITNAEDFNEWLSIYLKEPDVAIDPVVHINNAQVFPALLAEVFSEVVAPGLKNALDDMTNRIKTLQISTESPDRFRVLMVGGFSNYYLVRQTIMDSLSSITSADSRFDTLFLPQDTALAISKGAALRAAGIIKEVKLCPMTVGLVVTSRVTLEKEYVEIIKQGELVDRYRKPMISKEKMVAPTGNAQLIIYLAIGKNKYTRVLTRTIKDLLPKSYIKNPDGSLRCGFSIDDNLVISLHVQHYGKDGRLCGDAVNTLGDMFGVADGFILV